MRKIIVILFLILTVSVSVNGFVTAFSADREAVISDSIAEFCAGTKCDEVSVAVVWGDKTERMTKCQNSCRALRPALKMNSVRSRSDSF